MPELFVSAGKGLVTRFGTGSFIGASRNPQNPKVVVRREDEVVRLSAHELRLYGRSYLKAIADGSLVERKEADFLAWEEKLAAEDKAREEAAKKAAAPKPVESETVAAPVEDRAVEQPAEAVEAQPVKVPQDRSVHRKGS